MLLSSRSKSRSRRGGGFTRSLLGLIDNLLGRPSKRSRRQDKRKQAVSMWVLVISVLVAFGGGFLMGGAFGEAGDATDPLRAPGRSASFVGELDPEPLSREAFIVAAYPDLAASAARQQAIDLTRYLQARGLDKARPYLWLEGSKGPVWVVAVYFDGETRMLATRGKLRGLPADVPDQVFQHLRNLSKTEWPRRYVIQ